MKANTGKAIAVNRDEAARLMKKWKYSHKLSFFFVSWFHNKSFDVSQLNKQWKDEVSDRINTRNEPCLR